MWFQTKDYPWFGRIFREHNFRSRAREHICVFFLLHRTFIHTLAHTHTLNQLISKRLIPILLRNKILFKATKTNTITLLLIVKYIYVYTYILYILSMHGIPSSIQKTTFHFKTNIYSFNKRYCLLFVLLMVISSIGFSLFPCLHTVVLLNDLWWHIGIFA